MYYVYILLAIKNRRFYIGSTNNLKERISQHKSGQVYTTKRMLPIRLIFYETFISKRDALRRERYFKTTKGKSSLKLMLRGSLKDK